MRTILATTTITVAALLTVSGAAHAAVLAQYTFQDSTTASSDTDPDSTASNISGGTGISPTISGSAANGNPAPGYVDQVGTGSGVGDNSAPDDEQFALDNDEYFSFTVTPTTGNRLNLAQLAFDADSEGTGFATPDDDWALYTSVDSGDFSSVATSQAIDRGGIPRNSFTTQTVDLSDAKFQSLTAPVEFRLYVWMTRTQTNSVKELRLDNFELTGTVVPEPSSLALLGLATVAAATARRRREPR